MTYRPAGGTEEGMVDDSIRPKIGNRVLAALPADVWQEFKPHIKLIDLAPGQVLCPPGKPQTDTFFPLTGTIVAVLVVLRDGKAVEATMIGREGVIGGIVTGPQHPSFAKPIAQIPGRCAFIATSRVQDAKERSAPLRDLFARYADALLAQVLQSVVCNAFHPMQQRLARRLLAAQDRVGSNELPLTQDYLAQMLGVHRSTVIRVVRPLQDDGIIQFMRGHITVLNRAKLEKASCECNAAIAKHFERVLPQTVEHHRPNTTRRRERSED
jgi:CRP-like cAMP-binding protein